MNEAEPRFLSRQYLAVFAIELILFQLSIVPLHVINLVWLREATVLGVPVWVALIGTYVGLGYDLFRKKVRPKINRLVTLEATERAALLADTLVIIAVRLAGPERGHLLGEWRSHLAGAPEDSIHLTPRRRFLDGLGFIGAASRMRLRDAFGPVWRPVDWVLMNRSHTRAAIALLVGAYTIYVTWADGLHALTVANWTSPATLWALLVGGAHYLRRKRGIELAAANDDQR